MPLKALRHRLRALGAGMIAGVVAIAGIWVLERDAPVLHAGLTGRGLPLMVFRPPGGSPRWRCWHGGATGMPG